MASSSPWSRAARPCVNWSSTQGPDLRTLQGGDHDRFADLPRDLLDRDWSGDLAFDLPDRCDSATGAIPSRGTHRDPRDWCADRDPAAAAVHRCRRRHAAANALADGNRWEPSTVDGSSPEEGYSLLRWSSSARFPRVASGPDR